MLKGKNRPEMEQTQSEISKSTNMSMNSRPSTATYNSKGSKITAEKLLQMKTSRDFRK